MLADECLFDVMTDCFYLIGDIFSCYISFYISLYLKVMQNN